MSLRHFPFQHPTFGTTKNPKTANHWRASVYYWWFEYLRRNVDYLETCERGGVGKCSDVFGHFGDVRSIDFKTWWTEGDRGAVLFAEPPTPTIRVISPGGGEQTGIQRENTVLIEVPLDLPITYLVRNFRQVVSKVHEGRKGRRQSAASRAMYVPTGRIDVAFLETALSVWDARNDNPKTPLWQIAQDLRLGGVNRLKDSDSPSEALDKKNVLAATASRYYRKASLLIHNAGEGTFP